jgi:hypothetical protein
MFEYILTVVFVIIAMRPIPMSLFVKSAELVTIIYVSYRNPLLGIICAFSFIKQLPPPRLPMYKRNPTRLSLYEQMRPKDSNTMITMKSGGLPPQSSLTGHMIKPFVENHTGKYTPF